MATLPVSQTHAAQLVDFSNGRQADVDVLNAFANFVENRLKVIDVNATDSQYVRATVAEIQTEIGTVRNGISGAANTSNVSAKANPVAPATNAVEPINEPGVVVGEKEDAHHE